MYGTDELVRLTELLRIGIKTLREIALVRTADYAELMDIIYRAEVVAADLDRITGAKPEEQARQ